MYIGQAEFSNKGVLNLNDLQIRGGARNLAPSAKALQSSTISVTDCLSHTHLQRAVRRHQNQANIRCTDAPQYLPGQLVWLSTRDIRLRQPCRKLSPRYIGPFAIQRQINPVTYRLSLPAHYRIAIYSLPYTSMSLCSNHTLTLSLLPPQGLVLRLCPLLLRIRRTTTSTESMRSSTPDNGAATWNTSLTGRDSVQRRDAGSIGRTFWIPLYSRTSMLLIQIVQRPGAVVVPVVGPVRQLELAVGGGGGGVLSRIHQCQHQTPSLRPLVPAPQNTNHHHLFSSITVLIILPINIHLSQSLTVWSRLHYDHRLPLHFYFGKDYLTAGSKFHLLLIYSCSRSSPVLLSAAAAHQSSIPAQDKRNAIRLLTSYFTELQLHYSPAICL
ncbi:hypothetical protein F2P79_014618 [Pimephales promelas]|nr:hypothetical protein F2P79_014618 [Pimephales promelas]